MHQIVLLGLNHKTAPVELRERIALSKEEISNLLDIFINDSNIMEGAIYSTCNRVEMLMTVSNKQNAVDSVKIHIAKLKKISVSQFEKILYIYEGDEAVRHVFKVASSLDSMIVGEPQILGQIKDAYRMAVLQKSSGIILHRLFHKTFSVAKRVRSETGIGDNAVSISYAAIKLCGKIFGNLVGKKVLLIGAGEMAELAVEHLIQNKVKDIFIANRTFERGVKLAKQFNGNALRFEEILDILQLVDIVISSTGSSEFIITRNQLKPIMRQRRNRPIFFIDIAVPRDIDPKINNISNAYLYDIDDFKNIVEHNIKDRDQEAVKGQRIIDENVLGFRKWHESLDAVPTIVALRKKIDKIAVTEIQKTINCLRHLSENDCQAIYRMTNSIINKILHDPTLFLKDSIHNNNKPLYFDLIRKMFKIE